MAGEEQLSTRRRFSLGGGSLQDVLPKAATSPNKEHGWGWIRQKLSSAVVGGSSGDINSWDVDELPSNFFDLSCKDAHGRQLDMAAIHGRVCLIVNVASF
jgi:hypothetical protein